MICPACLNERNDGDFLRGNERCYKCVYQDKIKKVKIRDSRNLCRVCQNLCGENRWVYCSKECAETGEVKQKKDYWTLKVKSV